MAGTPSVPLTANVSIVPITGGHEGHGAPLGSNANNSAFSDALNQAVAQSAGGLGAGHGSHGMLDTGSAGHSGGQGNNSSLGTSGASPHSGHFPIEQSGHAGHEFQQKMLDVRAYRQQILASNIANADTPGYKAVDIDIEEVARVVRGAAAPLSLTTTASGHLSGSASTPPLPLKYRVPYQTAADGNTVEMDIERQKFAENALLYEFSLDRAGGHIKHIMELLQNLT